MRLFAWTGAALFLASLLYFAGSYFDGFGIVADGPLRAGPVVFDVALFSVFALHHSIFSRTRAKALVARAVPPALERSTFVWIASLMFVAVCAFWRPVPGVLWTATGLVAWLLRLLVAAGLALTAWAAGILDVFELSGTRFLMRARPSSGIVTTGPFGLVRHPIYLGWLLIVWPVPLMNGTRLVFAAVSTFYLLVVIPIEERSLRASAGAAYRAYAAQVRWRVLPFLY